MSKSKIIKNSIECVACGDIIESVHCHDFKHCKCGAIAIDGGKDYRRIIGNQAMIIDRCEYIDEYGKHIKINKRLETVETRNERVRGDMNILEALIAARICVTNAEARRLISCNVVKQNGYTYSSIDERIEPLPLYPITIGKRAIHNIENVSDQTSPQTSPQTFKVIHYIVVKDLVNQIDNQIDIENLEEVDTDTLEEIIDCLGNYDYETEDQKKSFIDGLIAAAGFEGYSLISHDDVTKIEAEIDRRNKC